MRISRIIAGLFGLFATLFAFALAVAVLSGWPESLQWLLTEGAVGTPHVGGWWGLPRWDLGVMIVGFILVGLLLAIPLVLLYGFVRPTPSGDDPALQRLRERYANGDIDDEEYERRLRRLEG